MIEVEIKVKIKDPDEMRKVFVKNNGVYKLSLLHEDTYFNMPKGLRDFKQTDEALRIRKSTSFDKDNEESERVTKFYITYKGTKIDTETKTRRELESIVKNGDILKDILKTLGFQEVFTVEKKRELFDFVYENHTIEALIDYIPILKEYFVEVEYVVDSTDKIEEARDILYKFLQKFGISKEESIRKSYLELIADKFKSKRKK